MLKIETKSWKLMEKEGQKIIAGSYVIKSANVEVASKDFNDGYGSINIPIPASVVAKAEELDKEVKKAIEDNFGLENK